MLEFCGLKVIPPAARFAVTAGLRVRLMQQALCVTLPLAYPRFLRLSISHCTPPAFPLFLLFALLASEEGILG